MSNEDQNRLLQLLKHGEDIGKIDERPYFKRKKTPKTKLCENCGEPFEYHGNDKQRFCFKAECRKACHLAQTEKERKKREEKTKREFSHGTVYVLDMENWTWKKEIR